MCFGSTPKAPDVQASPIPPPAPVISPSQVSPQATEENRQNRIQQLKYGLASTIKTGPRGIVGNGPELAPIAGQGKTTLG